MPNFVLAILLSISSVGSLILPFLFTTASAATTDVLETATDATIPHLADLQSSEEGSSPTPDCTDAACMADQVVCDPAEDDECEDESEEESEEDSEDCEPDDSECQEEEGCDSESDPTCDEDEESVEDECVQYDDEMECLQYASEAAEEAKAHELSSDENGNPIIPDGVAEQLSHAADSTELSTNTNSVVVPPTLIMPTLDFSASFLFKHRREIPGGRKTRHPLRLLRKQKGPKKQKKQSGKTRPKGAFRSMTLPRRSRKTNPPRGKLLRTPHIHWAL